MPKPGQAVEILIFEGEYIGRYRTHVDEVGEKLVSVVAPYFQGQVIPLREGTKVEVIFWDETSAYNFEAQIMQRIAVPVSLFVLQLPDTITRIQRRNYVRVPAFYALSFRLVTQNGLSDLKKGNLLDMSGGGIRMQITEQIEDQALLYARLELPTGEIQTPGRVCRVEKLDEKHRYAISVEFYEISERDRDRIVRCVFDLQRAMRKKGLV